jgi:hypothetical protein
MDQKIDPHFVIIHEKANFSLSTVFDAQADTSVLDTVLQLTKCSPQHLFRSKA